MSHKPLRVLIAEDNPSDADLMVRELRRAGFAPDFRRVDTEGEFVSSLDPTIDIILSDFSMPQFGAFRALELARQHQPQIPFIVVSGSIGEETAVETMRAGAADYLLKDRLTRLGQAAHRALEQKRVRCENDRTQATFERLRRDYELILNSAGEGICGVDLSGKISFANPKAGELLGWRPEELLGKSIRDLVRRTAGKVDNPVGNDAISECIEKGCSRRVTNDLFRRKDGGFFRVDYICAPIKDERDRVTGTILTFKDITEQFDLDARLKLQAEQYRLLFETNPNPMWVYDTKGLQILAVNKAAISQYGYSREEFLYLTITDLRPVSEVPALMKAMTAPRNEAHFSGQFHHVKKDGSPMVVEVYSGPIVWDGTRARIVTSIDVTEQKSAEERLREQAEIINRAHDAIIIRNFHDFRIVFWNKGAERLFGWSAEDRLGQTDVNTLSDPDQVEKIMSTLVSAGEFRGELKYLTKDGAELICDVRETLVRNPDGTPRSILIICTDITEQKKLETQLLRAQRLESIGTLAGGVAHDLNNILTPILMSTQALYADQDEDDRNSAVGIIEESARRGANIVKQVLTFARGVEGERVLIKPSHLIEEMIDIARRTFPKSIDIISRYPEDIWSLEADPTQLHQVLLNLSVNARDAMPDGGSLIIEAQNCELDESESLPAEASPGDYVVVNVTDTGHGMSRETIEKIFDPFFTTKELGKGTGLGLSTTVGIVKSHGGFLTVHSEPGNGTTFKIFLPGRKDHERTEKASQTPVQMLTGNGETVLMVDDEETILRVTQMILEEQNYQVIGARDGQEALEMFTEQKDSIHAVLTDLMLPHMDGIDLIREIRKVKPDTIVIASTGQGEEARDGELQGLGVSHLLTKPYDSRKLLTTLQDAMTPTLS